MAPNSTVETYVAARLGIDSWRWAGVPFFIRAGKGLPVSCTEVRVDLKLPPRSVFGESFPAGSANYVRFRLGPDVAIALGVRSKTPGEELVGHPVELVTTQDGREDMMPYERLLGDAMNGDATLFAREDSVEAAWKVVDPVLGDKTPVHVYPRGSWGPAEANALIAPVGAWHDPAGKPSSGAA